MFGKLLQAIKGKFAGNAASASGDRSVAVGGNADEAIIATAKHIEINVDRTIASAAPLNRSHTLPPDLADFTGREDEVGKLHTRLSGAGGSAAISALDGLGGIGKSALAVHVGHRLASDYPAGQLMLDLRGTGDAPVSPSAIMSQVILSLQPTAQLPDDDQAIAAIYRDLLTGGKFLLILDNARDAAQAAPLLPPPPSAAIITSRQPMVLANVEAHRLGILPKDVARSLLREITGADRVTDENLTRIAAACGYLPLALRVAGTFLILHPAWSVDEYLVELENTRTRLKSLQVPDHELDVAKTLGTSITQLEKEDAELALKWRKLSVFPRGFDRRAAAAVWDCTEAEARQGLDALMHRTLTLYDAERGRHSLHDLMRDMARLEDEPGALDAALAEAALRHADHYRAVLAEADDLYLKGDDAILSGLALFDLERSNIEAGHAWAVAHLEQGELPARLCFDYTNAGVYILSLRQHRREAIVWLEAGLAGARKVGDRRGEGASLGNLGLAWANLGEARKAIEFHEQQLVITREIGNQQGEGNALGNLGNAWADLGEARKAIALYEQQLVITREIGDRRGEGNALGNLGTAWADLGEARKAIEYHEQALVISREIGDRRGEGSDLGSLGLAWADLGEARKAIELYEQRLVIAREIGDRRGEGNALGNLGTAWANLGEARKAIEYHEQALVISREIGDRRGEGTALGNLGNAWANLGEARKAIAFYEQQLVIAREIGERLGEGAALYNSACAFKKMGKDGEALSRAQAALEIYIAIESPNAEIVRQAIANWS